MQFSTLSSSNTDISETDFFDIVIIHNDQISYVKHVRCRCCLWGDPKPGRIHWVPWLEYEDVAMVLVVGSRNREWPMTMKTFTQKRNALPEHPDRGGGYHEGQEEKSGRQVLASAAGPFCSGRRGGQKYFRKRVVATATADLTEECG